jgi:hypothetical protein
LFYGRVPLTRTSAGNKKDEYEYEGKMLRAARRQQSGDRENPGGECVALAAGRQHAIEATRRGRACQREMCSDVWTSI